MRSPSTKHLFMYNVLTLGIYFLVWCFRSRAEIHRAAQQELVPPTWYLVVPAANYWWMWRYAEALQFVSYKRIKASDTFLFFIIGHLVPFSIAFTIVDLLSNLNSSGLYSDSLLATSMVVMLLIFLVSQSIGLAFFCTHVQKRINTVRHQGP